MKYGLAIHTSSPELGLAIGAITEPCPTQMRCQTWHLGREVSGQLQQVLLDFLAPQTWPDLAFIAVAQGPGGFTGTRLGVVTARTLAQQLEIPLFGISSLAAIAQAHAQAQSEACGATPASDALIAVQMPAQRGEFHTAIYQLQSKLQPCLDPPAIAPTAVLADTVLSEASWQAKLTELQHPAQVILAPIAQAEYVSALWQIAWQAWQRGDRPHWAETLPIYGQHPVQMESSRN
jgi:tRNA threonylcarbamoyl adenosine modification protein YeaZ